MNRIAFALILLAGAAAALAAQPVLIVADEFPAMQVLAGKLKDGANLDSRIVKQTEMPQGLGQFQAVIVYIHGDIREQAERAFISYTKGGGKLVLLHHSISSGKRRNRYWIPFVAVNLPYGEFSEGGYKWIDPVTLEIVNLAPDHYITTHQVKYEAQIPYLRSGAEKKLPGFTLAGTEVYLNHVFTEPRTILLGLKYNDAVTGKVYMEDTAGWYKRSGQGWIIYFMAGHTAQEFEHPAYGQMVVNAVVFKP
jgi:hypothetical protein